MNGGSSSAGVSSPARRGKGYATEAGKAVLTSAEASFHGELPP